MAMQTIELKSLPRRLALGLAVGGLAPALAMAAPAQSFQVHGQARVFQATRSFVMPFIGTMTVDPNFADSTFGIVGRVVSMTVRFPTLPEVPAFDTIAAQGPEISGITPPKYDVALLNANGEQAQFQFTTRQSPATFPGFGTPMGSLVNFNGGVLMQGSNTGPVDAAFGHGPVFLQDFRGYIAPSHRGRD
jgi:hypothetical protein